MSQFIDYVEVDEGQLYELAKENGPIVRGGVCYDAYIDHKAGQILINWRLAPATRCAIVSRASCQCSRELAHRRGLVNFIGSVD